MKAELVRGGSRIGVHDACKQRQSKTRSVRKPVRRSQKNGKKGWFGATGTNSSDVLERHIIPYAIEDERTLKVLTRVSKSAADLAVNVAKMVLAERLQHQLANARRAARLNQSSYIPPMQNHPSRLVLAAPHFLNDMDLQSTLITAKQLVETGRLFEAKILLDDACVDSPESARAHYTFGDVLELMGEFGKAAEAFERALKLGIKCKTGSSNHANAAFQAEKVIRHNRGNTNKIARLANDEGVKFWQDYHGGHLRVALVARDRYPEQVAHHAQSALNVREDSPLAHFLLGEVLFQKRKFKEAETHLRRAVALHDSLSEAFHTLRLVVLELGRPDEAATLLLRAEVLTKTRPEVQLARIIKNLHCTESLHHQTPWCSTSCNSF